MIGQNTIRRKREILDTSSTDKEYHCGDGEGFTYIDEHGILRYKIGLGAVLREPPVRLCCMQRHYGPMCPDGKVMCCLCFDRFPVWALNTGRSGYIDDVCVWCAEEEHRYGLKKSEKSA